MSYVLFGTCKGIAVKQIFIIKQCQRIQYVAGKKRDQLKKIADLKILFHKYNIHSSVQKTT
jgi:hypothetical protein